MKNLPVQKEIEIGKLKILLVHGSPRKNNENIYPNLKIEKVEEMIKGTNADIIFCGHTHKRCGYQTNTRQTVVNAGSVGRPFSEVPDSCYVVMEVNEVDSSFDINKEHFIFDPDTSNLYTEDLIIRDTNINNNKKIILV